MPEEDRSEVAALFDKMAEELEMSARHCRVAAKHFRDRDVPRGAAHGLAAYGSMLQAHGILDSVARRHASRSTAD